MRKRATAKDQSPANYTASRIWNRKISEKCIINKYKLHIFNIQNSKMEFIQKCSNNTIANITIKMLILQIY